MPFAGFGPNALTFFKALAFHQSKEWFDENRKLYEDDVKTPLGELVEDLSQAFAHASIPLQGSRKASLFRINRDVRFSKNKNPYKTNGGALLSRSGTKSESGIFYIHLGTDGCFTAAGFYMPEPPVLMRLRNAIVRDPKAFSQVVAKLKKAGLGLSQEERLTRLPRGFEQVVDPMVVDALKNKSFICSRPFSDARMAERGLVDDLVGFGRAALPLLDWGWAAVADSR